MIDLKPGDVVGFLGRGFVSNLINLGTFGHPCYGFSHVAIMGKRWLYESTTMSSNECAHAKKRVWGVQVHDPEEQIYNFDGIVHHLPLVDPLIKKEVDHLEDFLSSKLGVSYDFVDAIRSANFVHRYIYNILRREDSAKYFCSELVMDALQEVNRTTARSSTGWSPNSMDRYLRRTGTVAKKTRITDQKRGSDPADP